MSLNITELTIVLGALDALFLVFILLQFRYFFGGSAMLGTSNLSYSDYARRGFFELVWVAALVLPLLLFASWLLRTENPRQLRRFRALAGALVLLVFAVMISAVQRMLLYTDQYGLTELRLYPTAFMAWLAMVFVWYLLTVLRGNRNRFVFGALMVAFAMALFLNCLNPDDLIVRTNLQRRSDVVAFDAAYNSSLSADAVPSSSRVYLVYPPARGA